MEIPKIKYTLISRNKVILVEDYEQFGSYVDRIPNQILPKVKKVGRYMWTSQDYNYIYIKQFNGLIVLAMFDRQFDNKLAQLYLEEIQKQFLESCSEEEFLQAVKMFYLGFRDEIKEIAKDYNENYEEKVQLLLDNKEDRQDIIIMGLNEALQQSDEESLQDIDELDVDNKDQINEEQEQQNNVDIQILQPNQKEFNKEQTNKSEDVKQFLNIVEQHNNNKEKNTQSDINQIQNNTDDINDFNSQKLIKKNSQNINDNFEQDKQENQKLIKKNSSKIEFINSQNLEQNIIIDNTIDDKTQPLIENNNNQKQVQQKSKPYNKCKWILSIIFIILLIGLYIFFAMKCGYKLNNCNFQLNFLKLKLLRQYLIQNFSFFNVVIKKQYFPYLEQYFKKTKKLYRQNNIKQRKQIVTLIKTHVSQENI